MRDSFYLGSPTDAPSQTNGDELAILERSLDSIRHPWRVRPPERRTGPNLGETAVQQLELVEQARRGDHDAFAALAGAAIPRLDALARLILRDPERGKDATQEALVRAWRDLPSLRDPEHSTPGSTASSSTPAWTRRGSTVATRSRSS